MKLINVLSYTGFSALIVLLVIGGWGLWGMHDKQMSNLEAFAQANHDYLLSINGFTEDDKKYDGCYQRTEIIPKGSMFMNDASDEMQYAPMTVTHSLGCSEWENWD